MSGEAELERTLRQIKRVRDKLIEFWRKNLRPLTRFPVIRGVLIGRHSGPLSGARITLNGWRTVSTNRQGQFTFRFVFRPVNLITVEWREAELVNWIRVESKHRRVTRLKLKWPPLIRGQVVNSKGEPVTQLPVVLNEEQVTSTDAHGTFIFPLTDEQEHSTDQLLFKHLGQTFVHHFKASPQEQILHRFILDDQGGLYHLEDLPSAQASVERINLFAQRLWLRLGITCGLCLIILILISHFTPQDSPIGDMHNRARSQHEPQQTWQRAGLLERQTVAQDQPSSPNNPPMWYEQSKELGTSDEGREELFEHKLCSQMEFTYRSYVVPRGMEGILLSLIFGRWQSWRGELSTFNGLASDHQLQAGQRVKLKLPLHPWSIYYHSDEKSWRQLMAKASCQESHELICKRLIQAWNPHAIVSRLRKGDQLLVNLDLLTRRPFEGATYKRIEGLRRSPQRRRSRARLNFATGCQLPPTLNQIP